jgi:sugar-specific transcriptional regulator TrmB
MRNTLKQLGLNDQEVQIYLISLSLPQTPASIIAKKCWLKRTTIYPMIEKLCVKGLLSKFIKSNTTYYHALEPEILVEKFKQNSHNASIALKNIESFLPVLKNLKWNQDEVKVSYFEGFEGLKNMLNDGLLEKHAILSLINVKLWPKELVDYWKNEFAPARNKIAAWKWRAIVLDNDESGSYLSDNFDSDLYERITISQDVIPYDGNIQIYWNKVCFYAIEPWSTRNMYGILIQSNIVARTMTAMFEWLWMYWKHLQK